MTTIDAWQKQYALNVSCQSLHKRYLMIRCIVCHQQFEFDTDKHITVQSLKCKACKDKEPNFVDAAKIVKALNSALSYRHLKYVHNKLHNI